MLFHGYFRSSAAYRCRIAFNLKGVSTDFVSVHLWRGGGEQKSEAYQALNPQALVPALETDDGLVLTQSMAIIEWLDETHPEPAFLPEQAGERALVRGFAQAIACDIHPLQNLRVLDYLKGELGHDQAAADAWCRRWIGDGLAACERLLERGGANGRFAFGDTPGLADICLIPQMFSADRFGVDLAAMPRLRAVREACKALPAFADAHPARQPDSEA
ncbi:maleylacetoacetate isomerase [Devosia nitrariae]|nr:maleylacetoacetate isomerase [Devosia nitrariae]